MHNCEEVPEQDRLNGIRGHYHFIWKNDDTYDQICHYCGLYIKEGDTDAQRPDNRST